MAGPSPGSLVSQGQNGPLHNVLFYLPQQMNGNTNQFANGNCHNQHGGTLNHLSYMQTSHNRYRPDPSLNKVHCFPTDNPYSCDRDTNGSYWSYQQQHQQQWNQWNGQNDFNQSENVAFKQSCWMQQQQQQQQHLQQQHVQQQPMQQRQSMASSNPSCMGFNPQQQQYNQMQQQQQQQQQSHHLQQQQQQHQFNLQQQQQQQQSSSYRNNVVATVTVQSTSQSLSRTPSRCDSVRSETCESHCSSSLSGASVGSGSVGIEDMTGQQYGMYQQFSSSVQHQYLQQQQPHLQQHQEHVQHVQQQNQQHIQQQQQQQQQQCFWPSSHYDGQPDQQQQQQQMDYFRQQQQQQQQMQLQQQQQYYRQQHQMVQQQQSNCYWTRDASPSAITASIHPPQESQVGCSVGDAIPTCSPSPIAADTTTTTISISSTSSPPHFPAADESVECVPPSVTCDDHQPMMESPVQGAGGEEENEEVEDEEETTIPPTTDDAPAPAATPTPPTPPAPTLPIVSLVTVPAGWTRDVSAGSVFYISPGGCRISSLEEAASYVQRNGTCKCGLPCPLRLQHVFNFDPSVPCDAATSLDTSSSSCCHKQSLDANTDKGAGQDSEPAVKVAAAAVKRKKNHGSNHHVKTHKAPKSSTTTDPSPVQQQQQPLLFRRSPCPNVDVRQMPAEYNRPPTGSLLPQVRSANATAGPSFFDDPSAYLAQQTVLLQTSLQNGTHSAPSTPPPPPPPPSEPAEQEQSQEEMLGDLLDCIPDSMEEVLDRQKDVAAAAEAAAQAEKAANLVKQAAAAAAARQQEQQQQLQQQKQQQQQPAQQQTLAPKQQPTIQPSAPKPQKSLSASVALTPARTKPPPLAIRPATPASAARSRAKAAAAEVSSKSTKSRSPRRTHHQPIQIQSNAKILQPANQQQQLQQQPNHQQQQQQQQQLQQQQIQQQQHQFWPTISAPSLGPLRTTSFPFTYHSAAPGTTTPIFSTAAIRPGNLPMTFLTSAATHPHPTANVFNQSLPVLTTRPALAPSGQVVHVLTTPGPMLTAAPLATEPSTTVPILTVGPMNHTATAAANHSTHPVNNNNSNNRGLTRTGKKRKSTPQTVASILQQGAQLAAAMTQQQQQHHQPQQHHHHHQATTLTLSQEPLLYNVQNFQQIQPQQTIQTLALMPDGKTYVVVNSQPAPAPQPTHQPNTGHWLLSPRPANSHPQAAPTLIAPAGQPVNVFCTTQTPGTTFVLNGPSAPTTQVLQLQDGTLVQTTSEQPNLLANYGGLFIRCPTAPTGAQIFSTSPALRTLPLPIPIAPGRSPGRSPDSSSVDGVTSSSANATETPLVACGEATPPSSQTLAVRTAHPSPVVQSSQIDSCVQEVDNDQQPDATKKSAEFNNNVQPHWLKPGNNPPIVAG